MGDLTEYNVGYLNSFHSFGCFKSAKSWPYVVKNSKFLRKKTGDAHFQQDFCSRQHCPWAQTWAANSRTNESYTLDLAVSYLKYFQMKNSKENVCWNNDHILIAERERYIKGNNSFLLSIEKKKRYLQGFSNISSPFTLHAELSSYSIANVVGTTTKKRAISYIVVRYVASIITKLPYLPADFAAMVLGAQTRGFGLITEFAEHHLHLHRHCLETSQQEVYSKAAQCHYRCPLNHRYRSHMGVLHQMCYRACRNTLIEG